MRTIVLIVLVYVLGHVAFYRYSKRGRLLRRYQNACWQHGASSEEARSVMHAIRRLGT